MIPLSIYSSLPHLFLVTLLGRLDKRKVRSRNIALTILGSINQRKGMFKESIVSLVALDRFFLNFCYNPPDNLIGPVICDSHLVGVVVISSG